jgi:hypothetical protein
MAQEFPIPQEEFFYHASFASPWVLFHFLWGWLSCANSVRVEREGTKNFVKIWTQIETMTLGWEKMMLSMPICFSRESEILFLKPTVWRSCMWMDSCSLVFPVE